MPSFIGRTSSAAQSTAYNIPCNLISFSIVNLTGGAVTVNVGVLFGSTFKIIPLAKSIAAGDYFVYSGPPILIPANYQISLTASGSVDYCFSIQ